MVASQAGQAKAGNQVYRDEHLGKIFQEGLSFSGYERDHLYMSLGSGRFVEISGVSGTDSLTDGRGAVFADFDNDGDLDVFLTAIQGKAHSLFRNNVGSENSFVRVALELSNRIRYLVSGTPSESGRQPTAGTAQAPPDDHDEADRRS